MRTRQQFLDSLDDGREVYYRGKKVDNVAEHPVLKIAAGHASKLFEFKNRTVNDPELGEISRYFLVPESPQDLMLRHRMIYETTLFCNGVFNISQAIGSDSLFALRLVSAECDRKLRTDYGKRVKGYHETVSKEDLTLAVAQTDVKGDRKKRPHEQLDPDMYVHVSSVEKDGIIVRGAKAHTTQSAVSNEVIVIPTRAMVERDSDYAVAFAVPASAEGLKMIVRPIEEL